MLSLLSMCCLVLNADGPPGVSGHLEARVFDPSLMFSSVLGSYPNFAGISCPPFPAITVAATANTVACEKIYGKKLRIKRDNARRPCSTVN